MAEDRNWSALADGIAHVQEVYYTNKVEEKEYDNVRALRKALKELALPCSEKEAEDLLDSAKDHKVSPSEFLLFCLLKEFRLKQVFDSIGTTPDQGLRLEEFQRGLRKLGFVFSDDSVAKDMFTSLDEDRSRTLSYREFRALVRKHPKDMVNIVDKFHKEDMSCYDIGGFNLQPRASHAQPRISRDLSVHTEKIVNLLAGFVAGVSSRTLTAPAERVKTELQVVVGKSPGIRHVVRQVYKEAGLRGFFQGNFANCIKVAPQSGLFFVLIAGFKKTLPTRGNPHLSALHSFLSGSLAGISSQFIIYPLEPIKTVLTVAPPGRYSGLFDAGRQLLRHKGVAGLYSGCFPTIAGCIPYAGFQFLTHDYLQHLYMQSSHGDKCPPFGVTFLSALISSFVGMTVSYPFMVVRTRLQVQGTTPDKPIEYSGVTDCFKKTWAKESFPGFMRGIGPNLAKAAPAAAMNLAVYEKAKDIMQPLFLARS